MTNTLLSCRRLSLLVLLGIALGIALPIIGYIYPPPPKYLLQLPDPPAPASGFVGISSTEWYEADAYVTAADGQTYVWRQGALWGPPDAAGLAWQTAGTLPRQWQHQPCWERAVARIARDAGPIGQCLAADLTGEWCPPPRVSFGIDGAGGVWLLSEERRCGLLQLTVPWLVTVPAGFVLGLALAAGGEVVARVRRRRQHDSGYPPIL